MTLTVEKPAVTFEQFLELPDADRYELVDGTLLERKKMGAHANFVAMEIGTLLNNYCHEHNAGAVFGAEMMYRCFGSKDTTRKPDISFIRAGRLTDQHVRVGYFTLVPDLAVEVASPNDLVYPLEEKLDAYNRAGVPLVWVAHPNTRRVWVHRADGTGLELGEDDEIKGDPVLPGFACKVRDFFPPFPPPAPVKG